MDARERQTLLAALASAQASVDLALALAMGENPGCQHARRADLSGFGDAEHWICLDCKLEVGGRGKSQAAIPDARGAELPD